MNDTVPPAFWGIVNPALKGALLGSHKQHGNNILFTLSSSHVFLILNIKASSLQGKLLLHLDTTPILLNC